MKRIDLQMLALLGLALPGMAVAADSDDVNVAFVHYLGCLDGAAASPVGAGRSLDLALDGAESQCKTQLEVLEATIGQLFKDNLSPEEYAAAPAQVRSEVAKLVMQSKEGSRATVHQLIEQRRRSAETAEIVQQAADAAIKAAEAEAERQ